MKGSEKKFRTDFEEAWQDALEGAEMAPKAGAWQQMEAKLVEMQAAKYRQYYLFYRAAAAVILLFAVASVLYFGIPSFQTEKLTEQSSKIENSPIASEEDLKKNESYASALENQEDKEAIAGSPSAQEEKQKSSIEKETNEPSIASAFPENTVRKDEREAPQTEERKGSMLKEQPKEIAPVVAKASPKEEGALPLNAEETAQIDEDTKAPFSSVLPDNSATIIKDVASSQQAVALEKYGVETIPFQWLLPGLTLPEHLQVQPQESQIQEKKSPQLYANLNVNSDFFNPNFSSNQESLRASSVSNFRSFSAEAANVDGLVSSPASQAVGQENTPRASFTYGINMGMKLSKHWVVESGISYANYNTSTRTRAVVSDYSVNEVTPLTVQNSLAMANKDQFSQTFQSEFGLNNSFEFASVPVTAGYVLGINKFNLILKAGVATDFFLRNEISDENDVLNTVTMTPGTDAPFRSVMLNGTVGNEINYKLNKHYSFSLTANYRFALQSFTKPEESFNSLPNAYGLGMAFRYHFND